MADLGESSASSAFQLGSHFRVVSACAPSQKSILKRSLIGFGMDEPPVRMIQSIFVISRLTGSKAFGADGSCNLAVDPKRLYKKANIYREIRDEFLGGDIAVRRVFGESSRFLKSVGQECFNEVVGDVFKTPIDPAALEDPSLREACARLKLAVTRPFKKQLESLSYSLQLQVHE